MMIEYYLIESYDSNKEVEIDVSNCSVDGSGDVSEIDAAHKAINQLGWILCAREKK